ncbi:MAG: GIY-YIG nuclease family protein [Flavobacterium sp.]|uniref:GIY-YIG nuclease family protein n=1 Tax=Flavobacterium sp. TaxID=239 RepID=UPI00326410A2
MTNSYKNFYWITTIDNHENWFVVSFDEYLAENFFIKMEGYDIELVHAKKVCSVIIDENEDESYFPSDEMLLQNGFEIINNEIPKIVWKDGKKYCQGNILNSIIIEKSKNKLGLYIIDTHNSNLYKIGITKNITQRLKQFETGNPFEFTLIDFFLTENCRELERLIHKKLLKNKYRKEWFKLNTVELKEIGNFARNFIGKSNYLDEIVSPFSEIKIEDEQLNNHIKENDLPF